MFSANQTILHHLTEVFFLQVSYTIFFLIKEYIFRFSSLTIEGARCICHEINHSAGRNSASANGFASSDGRLYASSASFRNATTPFPMHHASAQTVSAGHNVFGQNTTGYNAMPGYRPTGFAATLEDNMRSGADAPYRHSRSSTTSGHRNERDRRARSSIWRYNPYSCEESTDRLRQWQSEVRSY